MLKKQWMLLIVLLFSSSVFADEATEVLEEGLRVNESLIDFLSTRQCEIGLVAGCNKPLSPVDIKELKFRFRELISWKKNLFDNILPENDWLQGRKFEIKKGPHDISVVERINPLTLMKEKIVKVSLNENSRNELYRLKVATATSLVMYDNFIRLSSIFSKAKKLRSIITSDMGTEGKQFYEAFSTVLKEKVWKNTELMVKFHKQAGKFVVPEMDDLEQYISSSFTGNAMRESDFIFRIKSFFFFRQTLSESQFFDRINTIGGKLSQLFGNTVGKVQFREGKLKKYASNPEVMRSMKRKLAPLDILFEKTPFRLTDKFIPGYYGHVAIWLGSPEELMRFTVQYKGKTIPLLDHPDVLPHLEKLSQGKLIVEALREPGVTMNTLEHFMDIDDLLVMKPNNVRDPGEHLLRVFQQIGKPYDFNFDVETESALICSELVYLVFIDEVWPTKREVGRFTISPDHVAWKAVDSCYEPVLMYTDGNEVQSNKREVLKRILESKSNISYTPVGHCN